MRKTMPGALLPSELVSVILREPTRKRTFTGHAHWRCGASYELTRQSQSSHRRLYGSITDATARAKPPFRILFAGADRFSCASLEALARQGKSHIKNLQVLVPPDRRIQRGLKQIYRPPLRILAEGLSLPVHVAPEAGLTEWRLPDEFTQQETGSDPANLLVTASFGYLVPSTMLRHFLPLNTLNVHPSLLPKYRGAAPIQMTIMNGDHQTGVTIQTLGKRFDEGQILSQEHVPVPTESNYLSLEEILARKGADLLVRTIQDLANAQAQAVPQDPRQVTYARKLSSANARIDWERDESIDVVRRYRALGHQYQLWTSLNGKRLQLHDIRACEGPGMVLDLRTGPGFAYFDKHSKTVMVNCADGSWLQVGGLQTEGRKALSPEAWWVGMGQRSKTLRFGEPATAS